MCGRISKFASSCEASLLRTHAFGDECFGAPIEVESYLFVDLAVDFRAAEDGSEPVSNAVQHRQVARDERIAVRPKWRFSSR